MFNFVLKEKHDKASTSFSTEDSNCLYSCMRSWYDELPLELQTAVDMIRITPILEERPEHSIRLQFKVIFLKSPAEACPFLHTEGEIEYMIRRHDFYWETRDKKACEVKHWLTRRLNEMILRECDLAEEYGNRTNSMLQSFESSGAFEKFMPDIT